MTASPPADRTFTVDLRGDAPRRLVRTTFRTSRLLDFCSRKELIAQTGHPLADWPLVVIKELVDNALDACEDANIAPIVDIIVDRDGIEVSDNGPGLPEETLDGVLDFSVRVSDREAYVAPDRGAQGNALKTLVAMPFVLDGSEGLIEVSAHGQRHLITLRVDRIRQQPVISHQTEGSDVRNGTVVRLHWPDRARSMLDACRDRFLQVAADFTVLNPHLTLTVDWFGERSEVAATTPDWSKWKPSDPTSPHWYRPDHLERLVAAYLAHDADHNQQRTVREFVSEFRGLSSTAKQKRVLEATGLARAPLSALVIDDHIDRQAIVALLDAMQAYTRPVKPAALGIVGRSHLAARLETMGCVMASFDYRKVQGDQDGVPWVVETAFGWFGDAADGGRRLVTGVNWSPGIVDPFRSLGRMGQSLDSVLEQQRAGRDEPVVLVLHLACPRVEYTDRGKSAVVIGGSDAAAT
ncbi:MAG: ATP-binding protein [Chloroflexota bacterium]